jgi:trimethylamine:corrinoid methyltransferase-like protein
MLIEDLKMHVYGDLIRQAPAEYREALGQEKRIYEEIQDNAKTVLAEVGIETRNKQVIALLETTGLAGYDESASRIYL